MGLQQIYVALEIWGAVLCLVCAFCLVAARQKGERRVLPLLVMEMMYTVLLLADAAAWFYRGTPGATAGRMLSWGNFMVFFLTAWLSIAFMWYVVVLFDNESWWKQTAWVVLGLFVLEVVILILNRDSGVIYYIDEEHWYHRGAMYGLWSLLFLIQLALVASMIWRGREKIPSSRLLALGCYIVIPVAAVIIQYLCYGYSIVNLAVLICLIVMFAEALVTQSKLVMEQTRELAAKKEELADLQTRIALSQIKPHFLYNVLNSIYYLCSWDPRKAREVINDFSEYLRMNIGSIETNYPIPFSKELEHVRTYLALEQIRFEKRLRVKFDIAVRQFLLPSLTVQPIVENAVRHGICVRDEGGTVTVATKEAEDAFLVIIKDDGVGFEPDKLSPDDAQHIGIRNVRDRLAMISYAGLSIDSVPGEGTTVTIRVPKDQQLPGGLVSDGR